MLSAYEMALDQKINLAKSDVVFSKNVSPALQASLA